MSLSIVPIQIFVAEQDLGFYVNHGMHLPGCRGALTGIGVAHREGWSVKRTNKGVLLDVVALRRMMDADYQPLDSTVKAFSSTDPAADKREQAKLRKALKVGDNLRKALETATEDDLVEWNGV